MEKGKNVVIVALAILVLLLGGILIYSNVNINNDNDVNINNENNNGNESVNNNEQNNENIYGDIKQLYPTLLEVSTAECSKYISPGDLGWYAHWLDGGDVFPEEENKFKKIPENIKEALKYFGFLENNEELGYGVEIYNSTSELKENSNTFYYNNLREEKFNKAWSEGVEGNGVGEKINYKYMFLYDYLELEDSYSIRGLLGEYSLEDICETQYNIFESNRYSNWYALEDKLDNCYFSTSEIIIENGYCKTKELWEKNGRVKTLKLTFEDGEEYILNLQDTMKPQSFKLEHKTKGIQKPLEANFEILDVYEGTTYQDTCITTLELKCDGYGIHKGY